MEKQDLINAQAERGRHSWGLSLPLTNVLLAANMFATTNSMPPRGVEMLNCGGSGATGLADELKQPTP